MKGRGAPGGMQNLLRQANQMQARMKKLQEELAEREHEASSGGGAVTIKVKGENKITAVQIKDDVFKSGDSEMLQDLILTAANEALRLARETHSKEMEKITGGMNIPGLF